MNMLHALARVEEVLPELLLDGDAWKDVDVDYHPPRVERLWRDWREERNGNEWRIYLHRIHPCSRDEALFHPHPWPSAMLLLNGRYAMGVGREMGDTAPPIDEVRLMEEGSRYAMNTPEEWHYVAPLGNLVYSLMITGKPWGRPSPKPSKVLQPLTAESRAEILAFFRDYFARRA